MAVSNDLEQVADLCSSGAKQTLGLLLALGPKPDNASEALLWDQQTTRLQGQLNSLSALVSKLTAAAIIQGLQKFNTELITIGQISKRAEAKISKIKEISDMLTKMAKVLDLGLALLAASAAPSPATIAAVVTAGTAVANAL